MKNFWTGIRWPKLPKPLANPVGLKKLHKKLFGQVRRKLTWRSVGRGALWSLGGLVLIVVFLFAWYAKDLPTPGKIRSLTSTSSTRLFDRNMKPLYTISGEKKRIIIEQKDIPDVIKKATIALEDRQFYQHAGLNFRGVARAILFRGTRGGGSTITQQFVKNTLLTNQHSLTRKIKEAILAVELEALFSKEEILTMYLNEIPYGGNNYGIEAATKAYFGKSAKDLTLAEAATLAALPQSPSTLSPYGQHIDRLVARRNFTLDSMQELGYATAEEVKAAKETELKVQPRKDSIVAPHFVLYVKEWLVEYFTKELGDKQLAEHKVEDGGLTVVTTLDLDKQTIGEDVLSKASEKGLKRAGASNAGLVAIDPKRGEVLTMVGSVDYYQPQFGSFNVATASRQPGSSFKPVVYAAAFKEKYNPATNLFDLRTDFGGGYEPDNFDGGFRGPISIRRALGNSLNIPAVKILALIGLDKALKTASDMGITTLTDKDRYGLSLVLGGGEVQPLEMATAYGVFANRGTLVPTTPILKITDTKGKELYNHEEPKDAKEVLDPQVAYEITSILSDTEAKRPVFSGVMGVLTLKDRPVASKTGTTNGYRDAWTIGYTPQIATAVWAGNNDNTPMNRAGGSVAAAPLWDEFMERVHQNLPVEQFVRPAGIQELTVDRLSGGLLVEGSEPIKDIFASWQVPSEKDNVHQRVRVCRENGLLADSNIPDELAEERTFAYVRSEKPELPNWEGPVRAWAIANGFNNRPPTEKCQANTETKPSVSLTEPANGAAVSGTVTIAATASAPSGIRSVEFLIDNTAIATATGSPYQTSYNFDLLSSGSHTITAIATSNNGATASHLITVTVSRDSTPPSDVSNFNGIAGTGRVSLSWLNPTNDDFAGTKIYVYADSSDTLIRTIENPSSVAQQIVTSLTSGVAYRFTIKAFDSASNESSGKTVILTPL